MVTQSTKPASGEIGAATTQGTTDVTNKTKKRRAGRAVSSSDSASGSGFRTYSPLERSQMMSDIAEKVRSSGCTFKEAIKDAGISEQTFYQWKKAAAAESDSAGNQVASPSGAGRDHSRDAAQAGSAREGAVPQAEEPDIERLQEENLRLRQIFAEKLMAANEELRRRIASL